MNRKSLMIGALALLVVGGAYWVYQGPLAEMKRARLLASWVRHPETKLAGYPEANAYRFATRPPTNPPPALGQAFDHFLTESPAEIETAPEDEAGKSTTRIRWQPPKEALFELPVETFHLGPPAWSTRVGTGTIRLIAIGQAWPSAEDKWPFKWHDPEGNPLAEAQIADHPLPPDSSATYPGLPTEAVLEADQPFWTNLASHHFYDSQTQESLHRGAGSSNSQTHLFVSATLTAFHAGPVELLLTFPFDEQELARISPELGRQEIRPTLASRVTFLNLQPGLEMRRLAGEARGDWFEVTLTADNEPRPGVGRGTSLFFLVEPEPYARFAEVSVLDQAGVEHLGYTHSCGLVVHALLPLPPDQIAELRVSAPTRMARLFVQLPAPEHRPFPLPVVDDLFDVPIPRLRADDLSELADQIAQLGQLDMNQESLAPGTRSPDAPWTFENQTLREITEVWWNENQRLGHQIHPYNREEPALVAIAPEPWDWREWLRTLQP